MVVVEHFANIVIITCSPIQLMFHAKKVPSSAT